MAKFKKGDRVRHKGAVPVYGSAGTIGESHSTAPWVFWDNGVRAWHDEDDLVLLTDEKAVEPEQRPLPELQEIMDKHHKELRRQERIINVLERIEKRSDTWKKTPRQRRESVERWLPMLWEAYHSMTAVR